MSVTLYDQALKNKIVSWIIDPQLVVLGPDETARLFALKADQTEDEPLKLPIIAIHRDRDIDIKLTGKRAMSFSGKVFNSVNGVSDHLNAIPIVIKYQIDIYTRYQEEADEYVRNFVFNIVNYPKMQLDIPYNDSNLSYTSYMTLQPTITDNSDIPERLIAGQFTRMSLRVALNDAYLFSYNRKQVPKITGIQIKPRTEMDAGVISDPTADIDIKLQNK